MMAMDKKRAKVGVLNNEMGDVGKSPVSLREFGRSV
jgi:hypothetical protein